MRLALARASVVSPTGEQWENVTVDSRNATLTIRQGTAVLYQEPALAVRPLGGRLYEVDTASGTYKVTRAGGCGCARG